MFCPWIRPISEEEINHLKDRLYTAISDKQMVIDQQLQVEVTHSLVLLTAPVI